MARNSSDTSEEIVTESSSSCEDIKAGKNSFIKWTSNLYERFEETQLYRYFYVTGIALVRKASGFVGGLCGLSDPIVRRFISARGTDAFWPVPRPLWERAREPFAEGFNWSLEFAEQLRKAKETGDHRKLLGETLRSGVKLCSDTTSRAFNYAAPVGGIAVLLLTIAVYSNLTFALSVEYNGQFGRLCNR